MRTYLVLALAIAGCTPEPAPLAPTPADLIPEVNYDALSIADQFADDGSYFVSPVLDAPLGATRTGVLVTLYDASAPTPVLEAREVGGEWRELEVTWREDELFVARLDLGSIAHAVELRVRASDRAGLRMLTWSAVIPEQRRETAVPEGDVGSSRHALRADIAALGVHSRAEWGARATSCSNDATAKYRFAIHHTVTPSDSDPATRIRGIQAYHIDTNGWCDIGYHFLVSIDGQLWEGRPVEQLGAHVLNNNSGNIGVSFIGCFHSSGCNDWTPFMPPDGMVSSGAGLVSGLGGIFGITPNSTTVLGHRDHSGQSTSCPGDYLHARLDDIRSGAVVTPSFAAAYVDQTFPLASAPFVLDAGQIVTGYLEMRNVGSEPWTPGQTFLGTTEPRDVASPIAAPDWIAPNRAATIDRVVAPGETGRFNFSVRGPDVDGDYPQYFNLVQEGVAWFSDVGQGGPPDNQIQIRVTVVDVPGGTDAGMPATDAGANPETDAGTTPDAGIPDDGGGRTTVDGCGCRAAGRSQSGALVWSTLALLAITRIRKRPTRPS